MPPKQGTPSQLPLRPPQGSSSGTSTVPQGAANSSTDPTDQLEASPIVPCSVKQTDVSPADKQKAEWATAVFTPVQYGKEPQRRTIIQTNFFRVNFDPNVTLHRYRIALGPMPGDQNSNPPKPPKPFKKPEIIASLLRKLLTVQRPPDTTAWISDYKSYVVTPDRLYEACNPQLQKAWKIPHSLSARAGSAPAVLDTTLHYDGTCNLAELQEYCKRVGTSNMGTGSTSGAYHPSEDVRTLNTVTWANINDPMIFGGGRNGKKFYPDSFSSSIPCYPRDRQQNIVGKVPVFVLSKGFFTSIRPDSKGGLLLNVNLTTGAFFPNVNLQHWLEARSLPTKIANGIVPRSVQDEIIGRRIAYLGDDPVDRKKRVVCALDGTVSAIQFQKEISPKNMVNTTVFDHHRLKPRQNWEQQQRNLNKTAICVNVGNSANPKYYPADYCEIVEYQAVRGKIDSDFTDAMLNASDYKPNQKRDLILWKSKGPLGIQPESGVAPKITKNRQEFQIQVPTALPGQPGGVARQWPSNFYSDFGLRIEPDLLKTSARTLTVPKLQFRQEKTPSRGEWNLKGLKFARIGLGHNESISLGLIRLGWTQKEDRNDALSAFAGNLKGELIKFGLATKAARQTTDIANGNPTEMLKSLREAVADAEVLGRSNFIVVVLKDKSIQDYATIKWYMDVNAGLPSICLTKKTMYKAADQDFMTLGNLCLKINFKTRGTSHRLAEHQQWCGAKANTMIVGADVTHPMPQIDCPSLAGVVATCDPENAHYLASARLQPSKKTQEYIERLDDMIFERLKVYHTRNRRLPEHILFYRDGVSESQFGMVKNQELPQIRRACLQAVQDFGVNKAAKISITLLVVGKRHHVRFFPVPITEDNLAAGLVVDTDVTSPMKCDFYLQSHHSALGTARSAHYIVLANDSNYTMEGLQELTNKLCYTGQGCTKALSYCTPARMADTLCDRLRCYMRAPLATRAEKDDDGNFKYTTTDEHEAWPYTWGWNLGRNMSAANCPFNEQQKKIREGRKNPWHPNCDNFMFYL